MPVNVESSRSGTPTSVWERDGRLGALGPFDLDGIDSVIVVAAHPDDELLGAGALIAQCARRGLPVCVLVVSDGAGCHVPGGSPATGRWTEADRPDVTELVHQLAPHAAVEAFGFASGTLAEHRSGVGTALDAAIARSAVNRTLVVAPWRGDGQHDHSLVGAAAAAVAERLGLELHEYPIWLWHWATPHDDEVPWESFVALPADEGSTAAKGAAIESLVASAADDIAEHGAGRRHPEFLKHFERAREVFVRRRPVHDRLDAEHFDALYSLAEDPWGFASRWYEVRRRSVLLASLPDERYATALEIGSSIGILTEQLARRCSELLAVDLSAVAVDRAKVRLADAPNVTVQRADVAENFPAGRFDLIVLSEVGYFFTRPVLDRVVRDILDALNDAGTLVVCHWRHTIEEYPGTGDDVHTVVDETRELTRLVRHEEEDFLLDVYSRDDRSVARRTGLL
jgi:LmbE family N-acetylglucosaminyl deacetylase